MTLAVIFIYSLSILVLNASKGLDITDESYYLLAATQPHNIKSNVSSFGFYTQSLLQLAGGNIAWFRILGFLVMCASALTLSLALIKYLYSLQKEKCSLSYFYCVCVICSLTMMTAILAYYSEWLLTPSYNWITVVTVCWIGSITLYYFSHKKAKLGRVLLYSTLLGVSGGLTFMAKPPTAIFAAIAVLIFTSLQSFNKQNRSFIFFGGIFALLFLLLHGIFFLDGVHNFYKQLSLGLDFVNLLDVGYSSHAQINNAYELLLKDLYLILKLPGVLLATIVFIIALILKRKNKFHLAKTLCSSALFSIILCQGFAVFRLFFLSESPESYPNSYETTKPILDVLRYFTTPSMLTSSWKYEKFIGERGLVFALSIAYATLILGNIQLPKLKQLKSGNFSAQISLIIFLFLLSLAPKVYSNGSIINANSFVFIVALVLAPATVLALKYKNTTPLLAISIIVSWATITNLNIGIRSPYRLVEDFNAQNIPVELMNTKLTLQVDKKTANYINTLKHIALKEGWQINGDLIDLTGGTPAASLILNATIMGIGWFLGGYAGSNVVAKKTLTLVSRDRLKSAWILTAPLGKRKIDESILNEFGLDFPNSYRKIGKLVTGHRNEKQILWKPKIDR